MAIFMNVKINSLLYFHALENNDLSSISFFVYMQKLNASKLFMFKSRMDLYKKIAILTGTNINTVTRHIKILNSYGLIEWNDYSMKLLSKDKQNVLYSKDKIINIPAIIDTLSKIKYFLKNIPIISNLKAQEKAILKKKHLSTIKYKLSKGIFVPKSDFNYYRKAQKKGVNLNAKIDNLRLSNLTGAILARKSKKTITAYKKQLSKAKFWSVKLIENVFMANITENEFKLMKKYEFDKLPPYSFFKKSSNSICFFSSSEFNFKYQYIV